MSDYIAPINEVRFLLEEVILIADVLKYSKYNDFSADLIYSVLEEAGKFVGKELASLNKIGDRNPAKYVNGQVEMPAEFIKAYRDFSNNGWNSLVAPTEFGGQGLPFFAYTAISEMVYGANMAFGLCPLLTNGAVELILAHASLAQQQKYLPNMISGNWTGTMCLTETGAGSDLGAIKTSAVKKDDHYLISGQKIFITYGEHNLTENIIHMVLARVVGAESGVAGISLFIVPKFLDGNIRNDVKALGIEHKLGIHASPTCIMGFGENNNCIGYLVGKENEGLKYMFTMMNNARLSVALEAIGVADYAYKQAALYADERVQFKTPIKNHPDVKRMLSKCSSQISSLRALSLYIAKQIDISKNSDNPVTKELAEDLVAFLIPVIKFYATNTGFEICSEAIQIFGGMGYSEEVVVAQALRDIRITMIYEGTNGIQAQDLVMRKLNLKNGQVINNFIVEWEKFITELNNSVLNKLWQKFIKVTGHVKELVNNDKEQAKYLATYYTNFTAIVVLTSLCLKLKVKASTSKILSAQDKEQKISDADFYLKEMVPFAYAYADIIEG